MFQKFVRNKTYIFLYMIEILNSLRNSPDIIVN